MAERDYSKLDQQANNLFNKMPGAKKAAGGRVTVQLDISEMPGLIPAGSVIELEKVRPDKLSYGDVIYVNRRDRAILCHFLRISGEDLVVARRGAGSPSYMPSSALCGRVVQVSHQGSVRNPNQQSSFSKMWNKLTDYGTTSPFTKLLGK